MKIALVVQRYGKEVDGGAELHARLVAEQMVAKRGWSVDVFTTTASDHQTWANHFPAGTFELNGVKIHRFRVWVGRIPGLFAAYSRFANFALPRMRGIKLLRWPMIALEWLWFFLQGPWAPGLVHTLVQNKLEYNRVFFFTYLYLPTLTGLPRLKGRAVLIPTAHDEPAFYFSPVQNMLLHAHLLLANSLPELQLLERVYPEVRDRTAIVGLGFEPAKFGATETEADNGKISIEGSGNPYILYLGRISRGEGVDRLIQNFLELRSHPKFVNLELKLAGQAETDINVPSHSMITTYGFVDDRARSDLIRGALAIVDPSHLESLSMVALEGMAAQKPLLVNRHCEVFRYYSQQISTAFLFGSTAEFHSSLEAIMTTDWTSAENQERLRLAANWANSHYRWDVVLAKYEQAVTGEWHELEQQALSTT